MIKFLDYFSLGFFALMERYLSWMDHKWGGNAWNYRRLECWKETFCGLTVIALMVVGTPLIIWAKLRGLQPPTHEERWWNTEEELDERWRELDERWQDFEEYGYHPIAVNERVNWRRDGF